jgi:hypothetical protein
MERPRDPAPSVRKFVYFVLTPIIRMVNYPGETALCESAQPLYDSRGIYLQGA